VRRAKPLLGTLVSIDVDGVDEALFIEASDRAFAHIAAIHAAMSFHEAGSDLRALARARAGDTLPLHADTCVVLQLALAFETRSGGAFNACCAATLVARSLLPAPDDASPPQASTVAEAIELLPDDRVRVLRPAWIDLGGIAKGYAVDVAVDELLRAGVHDGIVNAGGDLRVFGGRCTTVHLRDPRSPGVTLSMAEVQDMACATSAWSLTAPESKAAHVVGPLGDNAPMSVTVFAPSCAAADALTKIVWLRRDAAADLLRAHGAHALMLREDGSSHRL
jgi:thiamine biosynthesis lipoprotein